MESASTIGPSHIHVDGSFVSTVCLTLPGWEALRLAPPGYRNYRREEHAVSGDHPIREGQTGPATVTQVHEQTLRPAPGRQTLPVGGSLTRESSNRQSALRTFLCRLCRSSPVHATQRPCG